MASKTLSALVSMALMAGMAGLTGCSITNHRKVDILVKNFDVYREVWEGKTSYIAISKDGYNELDLKTLTEMGWTRKDLEKACLKSGRYQ